MNMYRDYRRRPSFSYRLKHWFENWFWSDHTKEIKMVFKLIGEFIITVLWLGWIFFVPHFFH